jgi:DNA-binding LacI/PurR family transcriptional regulator
MARATFKHEELTMRLRKWLQQHGQPGERFPSVKKLMDDYQCSQATLTHAMKPLLDAGMIYSVSGKGTFVGQVEKTVSGRQTVNTPVNTVHCIVSTMDIVDPTANSFCWQSTREIMRGAMERTMGEKRCFHVTPINPVVSDFTKLDRVGDSAFIFLEYRYFEPLIEYCFRQGIPYAVFSNHSPSKRALNQVWLDVKSAEIKMMELLISRGHRVIGYLGDNADSERSRGYREALRNAGITCRRSHMVYEDSGNITMAEGFAMGLLNAHPDMTAISCSSDERAEGAWKAARALGRNIEITGIDNLQGESRWFSQKLDFGAVGAALAGLAMEFDRDNCQCIRIPPVES